MGHYLLNFAILIALDMKWCFMDELPNCQNSMGHSSFCQIGDYPHGFNMQNSIQYSQARAYYLYYVFAMKENVL